MSMNQEKQGKDKDLIFEEKLDFMVPPTKTPTGFHQPPIFRNARFLKPIYKPQNPTKTLPKPPSLSLSYNPNIDQLKKFVRFEGRKGPLKPWDTWVDNLQPTHQEIWKKVGIFDAIRASTYVIKPHNELIIGLTDKWCPETNTFVFSFGEATITLEDVFILGGFSVLGECVRTPVRNREFEEIENDMFKLCANKGKTCPRVLHSKWMSHFMGIGGELEHIAFLVLWLSRYVFTTESEGYISRHLRVFPIAVCLARGTRIALAPAVLAAIYRDLGFLKAKIVEFVNSGIGGCSVLKLKAPFQLVQLWVWERFPMLGPEPAVIPYGAPRLARWRNLNRVNVGCLRFNFEPIDGVFVWRPYAVCVENWQFPDFYCNEGSMVLLNPEDGLELLSFAKCLRNCGLVGLDCIEQYLPHRVGMQFGMDQDVPGPVSRLDQSLKLAWCSYDEPIVGVRLYLPPKLVKGDVTVQYFDWWRTASYEKSENCKAYNADYDGLLSLKCGHLQENLSLHLAGSAEDNVSKGACLSSKRNVFAASDYQSEVCTRTYGENQPQVREQPQLNPCLNMDDSLDDYCENIADELFQNPDNSDWQAYMSLISGFGDSDWQAGIETISPSDKSTNLTKSHEGISKSTPLQNLECTSVEVLNCMDAQVENCEESKMTMAEQKSSETAMVEEREELMIDPTSSLPNETQR